MTQPRLRMPDDLLSAEAWQQWANVYDPELGISLVDLGLIYGVVVRDGEVKVEMTLTTAGCPMSETMPGAVERALLMIPGVSQVTVDLVWEPRWDPEMVTERAQRLLGWLEKEN
jgi:metal-sulfur cluster biosynthetic enzyme